MRDFQSSKGFDNPTKDERNPMYDLKVDKRIVAKGAGKVATVIVWNRENFLKQVSKKLEEKEVYMKVPNNPSRLVSTILKKFEK